MLDYDTKTTLQSDIVKVLPHIHDIVMAVIS